ncbi:XRE family transcriptional regulator [Chitinolyticbacter meiyuanensis]|uniref:XRE family transcriptional regulator n=1 Tax=Chitinolyticbacter meiyuanensis TaxID=682798 RepID=UPI001651F991|nr:XRE family transcriptional regulator [Chitinolyticbacter meiyuanensis]
MAHIGISQNGLADRSGVPQPTIQRIVSGDTDSPRSATLDKLAKSFGVTLGQFLEGPPADGGTEQQSVPARHFVKAKPHHLERFPTMDQEAPESLFANDGFVLIPEYTTQAACGRGFLNGHIEVDRHYPFPEKEVIRLGINPANTCLVRATGNSMFPYICEDDRVLLDLSVKRIENGLVYMFLIDDEARLKRVQRSFGTVTLTSDNPNKLLYPDEIVPPNAEIVVIGKVVWRGG